MVLIILLLCIACTEKPSVEQTESNVTLFDMENKSTSKLPKKLQELSGLAMTNDGRLFGHNDEKAIIYQISLDDGSIIKSFSLGEKTLKKDFEGIAIVDDLFYLVTSSGELYEFEEGENDSSVPYEKYKTKLSSKNDVEGLCYDPATESLLLACKGDPGKNLKGNRAVYSFSLTKKKLEKNPRFVISIKDVKKMNESDFTQKLSDFFMINEGSFAPSGIERHPERESFFIVSFHGRMIVEISSQGDIIKTILLDKKHHNQPEGITFSKNFSLIIGDEGGSDRAKITRYPAVRNK
jgi:uncharacterized protein YjiK